MIVAVFHLFQIQGEVALRNPSVVVQPVLGKRPESFNAIDVNATTFLVSFEFLGMLYSVVFPVSFQGVVAAELIGVVHRTLSGFLANHVHEDFLGYRVYNLRVDPAIPL